MIEFNVESFVENYDELYPLFVNHYHEIAMYQDRVDLSIDYERYKSFEESGNLHTIIVRDEGEIVGYSVHILNTHLHYKDDLFAINDIIYLDPEYRKGGFGKKLLEFTEQCFKEIGVSTISIHMKTFAAFEGLTSSAGYDKAEYIYTKCIKEKV